MDYSNNHTIPPIYSAELIEQLNRNSFPSQPYSTMNNTDDDLDSIMNMIESKTDEIERMRAQQADYDRLIPAKVHNAICYDEAIKHNEKLRKESDAHMSETIGNNSLVDILDEGSAEVRINQFDLGDITQYLEDLKTLSFFEAVSLRKKVDAEYVRWKSCNSMLNAVQNLKLDDNQNRQLMELNTLEDYNFSQSVEDFRKVYESNIDKYTQIISVLDNIINTNRQNSTTFLTNELLHMIDSRLANLPNTLTNYDYIIKKMNVIKDAFLHRENLQYLALKIESFLKVHRKKIKITFKNDSKELNNGKRTKIINELIRYFSKDIADGYYRQLMKIFHNDFDSVYLMTYFLMKIMNSEKETGKNTYAKVFIMNLSDINAGIYDYDESHGIDYENEIGVYFIHPIVTFLDSNNISLNYKGDIFSTNLFCT